MFTASIPFFNTVKLMNIDEGMSAISRFKSIMLNQYNDINDRLTKLKEYIEAKDKIDNSVSDKYMQQMYEYIEMLAKSLFHDSTNIEHGLLDVLMSQCQIELNNISEGTYDLCTNGYTLIKEDSTTYYSRKVYKYASDHSKYVIIIDGITHDQLDMSENTNMYHGKPVKAYTVKHENSHIDVTVCELYDLNKGRVIMKLLNNTIDDLYAFIETLVPSYYNHKSSVLPISIISENSDNTILPVESTTTLDTPNQVVLDKIDLGEDEDTNTTTSASKSKKK
jgi:hypothetical protein